MAINGPHRARRGVIPPQWGASSEGPPFVGRAEELKALDGAWQVAASGLGRTVLVLGEAGAGKSRLVAEASVRAAEGGAEVLVGCCLPDAPVAYEPFREPLGRLLGELAASIDAQESAALHDLLASAGDESSPRAVDSGVQGAFEAVVSLLRRAAADRPIVLILEDLHWATPSTLALLGWIVRRATGARLMILATSRNTRPDPSDELRAILTELRRMPGATALELDGLTAADIARLVVTEAGVDPACAPEVAERLLCETAGNPFLLGEICRDPHLRQHLRDSSGYPLHVPESVLAIFEGRLRGFPDAQRQILELAAVIGDRFPLSLLEAVTESDPQTMVALDRASDAGLLVALPDELAFAFPHALARQSILGLTSPARLSAAHGRVADVLEPRSGDTLPEVQRLAHHNLNAYGRSDRARRYLIRAAQLADRSWAYEEAARHFRRAGELSDTADERHRLLLCAAECLQCTGDYGAARDLAEQVVTQSTDPATRLAAATMVERESALFGGDLRAVQLLLGVLVEHPVDLSDPVYLRALGALSQGLGQVVDAPDAFRLHDAAVAAARRLGNGWTVGGILGDGLTLSLGRPGRTADSLRAARELTVLARRAGDGEQLGASGFYRCLLGMRAGTMDDVTAGVVDYRIAHDIGGHLWFAYWPEVVEFDLRFMRGDFAGAEQVACRLRDWALVRFGADTQGHYGMHMFQIRRETGRLAGVRDLVTGQEPLTGCWAPALLALYTQLRMTGPARRVLEALAEEPVLRANGRTEYMPIALAYLVEAALFLDDHSTLRRLRPLVAQHSGMNLVSDQFVALAGAADRYLGMIDSALGEGDPMASFDAAAELGRRCGFTVDVALTLTARAHHLAKLHGPHAPDVVEAVTAARAIAEPIGQTRVLRSLVELGPQRSSSRPAPDHGLTEREHQVLRLLADGASNREIAHRLTISENTAANHVRSILIKTGCANRTQAAMWAVSRGSVPGR